MKRGEREIAVMKQTDDISLWGFKITKFSPKIQFIIISSGIFFFYVIYGYLQELIFRLPGFKPYGWYLTLIQFAVYTILGKTEMKLMNNSIRRIPISTYLILALLTLCTMCFSNWSVGYINYPTQVVFKCCKLIPVMIGSVLIQGKNYAVLNLLAAILMSLGLIFFTLADSKVSPNFDVTGVIMICIALMADAVIGNVQEKAMKSHQASNVEVVFYSYSIGFVYLLFGSLIFGNLYSAIQFCAMHPVETYGYAVIFSITGYLGIHIVLNLIRLSGAFIAVTVTTLRKMLSIVISFIFFSKPFTIHYVWAGSLVVLGIYLNIYSKKYPTLPIREIPKWTVSYILKFTSRMKQSKRQTTIEV